MARGSYGQTATTPTSPVFASGGGRTLGDALAAEGRYPSAPQGPSLRDIIGGPAAPNLLGAAPQAPVSLLDPGPAINQAVGGMMQQPVTSGPAPMTLKDRAAIFSAALDSPSRGLQMRQAFAPAPQSAQQPAQDPIAALRARLAALGLGRSY